MKKLFGFILLGISFLAFGPKPAYAGSGTTVYSITPSTQITFQQIATGSGSLYNIMMATATTGDFVLCYDSASTSGYTMTVTRGLSLDGTTTSSLIEVFASTVTMPSSVVLANIDAQNYGGNWLPISFTNGLVCGQSAANRTKIYYKQP